MKKTTKKTFCNPISMFAADQEAANQERANVIFGTKDSLSTDKDEDNDAVVLAERISKLSYSDFVRVMYGNAIGLNRKAFKFKKR